MKTPSDDVFQLIKSLSSTEKRYFKVIAPSQDSEKVSKYHQLFDAIDEMETYDEQALLQKHKGKAFVKNLGMTKQYLLDSILKSLCSYHAGLGISNEINDKAKASQIMMEKGLGALSSKLLKKAIQLAEKYEQFPLLLQLTRLSMAFAGTSSYEDNQQIYEELHEKQLRIIEILRLESEYYRLTHLTHNLVTKVTYSRSEEDIANLRDILDHPLLRDESQPQTAGQRVYFYAILSRCYFILGEYEKSYKTSKKHIDAWEEAPHKIEENPLRYAGVLYNFALRCAKSGQHDELLAVIAKFRALPNADPRIRLFKFESLYTLELNYFLEIGAYDEALELAPEIEEEDREIGENANKGLRSILFYNLMIINFYNGRYAHALECAQIVLNGEEALPDLYGFTKIVAALIQYEVGNIDIFENGLRSVQRYLKKKERLFVFEDILIKNVKKLGAFADDRELRKFCQTLAERLKKVAEDPKEARALEYFDFIAWLESKAQAQPLAHIIRQKIQIRLNTDAKNTA